MTNPTAREPKWWKRFARRLFSLTQYLTGQEPSVEDNNDAIFHATFPELTSSGEEKRVLSRHRICIPAVLTYGIAASSENTEVTNLNERDFFVYWSTSMADLDIIEQ